MDNPFSWDYLTTVPGPNEVFGPFAIAFLIIFTIGFVVSIVIYNNWAKRRFKDPVLHRMAKRWAGIGLILFTLGLFFFLIRWLQINPFDLGMRIWMWLSVASLIALFGYMVYDHKAHYAAARAAYDDLVQQRMYARSTTSPKRLEEFARLNKNVRNPRPRPVRRKRA
ncbi:hypothetical protein BH23CHL4_BH23CHL4_25570 [soil metagenome]